MGDFIAMLSGTNVDINAAYWRMVRHEKPLDFAEQFTRREVQYDCAREPEEKAIRRFTRVYQETVKRIQSGDLVERAALPRQTVSNPIDNIRNGHKAQSLTAKSLQDRINRIQKAKKIDK